MAGSDKTVKVTLVAQTAPYTKGMTEASSATRKLGSDLDGMGSKTKGFASSAGQATSALKGMAVAGAAVAGTALVAFLGDAVRAAGDLEQSIGGVDAVFKDSAAQIHAFGETSAEAVGLSRNEFNQLITVTGAMLKNKGLEDFADKSLDLVKIGADLAATYGGSAKDAVEALNAAMRGESDPIERYGISLNETAVNAELAAKGLNGLTGAALEQAKAQARIDIVTRQSADALGAFGREADTLQGQQQRLAAEWENSKAALGQALLPALTSVTSALRSGVDVVVAAVGAFESIPGPVKAAVAALVTLHLLRGPLSSMLDGTIGKVKSLGDTLRSASFSGAARGMGSALMGAFGGPIGIAITGITAALGGFIQAQQNARAAAEDLSRTLDKQSGAFTDATREGLLAKFFGDFSEADYANVKQFLEQAGVGVSDLIAAYQRGGPAIDEFKARFDAFRNSDLAGNFDPNALRSLGNAYSALGDDIDGARVIQQEMADAQGKTAAAAETAGAAQQGLADSVSSVESKSAAAVAKLDLLTIRTNATQAAADAARQAHKDLADAINGIRDAAVDADEAEANWQQAIDDATESIKENGRTVNKTRTEIDLTTEAGRKNQETLIGLRDRAREVAEANLNQGDSVDSVKAKMQAAREEFVRAAEKMGLSKKAAQALADEYGLTKGDVDALKTAMGQIPKEVKSKVTVADAAARTAIRGIDAMLDALERTRYIQIAAASTVPGVIGGAVANAVRRADGGIVRGPGTTTSDSIPALLSDKEYVVRAAAVQKYGARFFDDLNAMRFASGGYVSRMPAPVAAASPLTPVESGPKTAIYMQTNDPVRAAREVVDRLEWRVVNG